VRIHDPKLFFCIRLVMEAFTDRHPLALCCVSDGRANRARWTCAGLRDTYGIEIAVGENDADSRGDRVHGRDGGRLASIRR
jgi:hypothetical protein